MSPDIPRSGCLGKIITAFQALVGGFLTVGIGLFLVLVLILVLPVVRWGIFLADRYRTQAEARALANTKHLAIGRK